MMESLKKNWLILLVLLWGASGSLGFIFNSLSLIYFAQGSVSSPVALVFDSPRNYSFWTNSYDIQVTTSKKKFTSTINRDMYDRIKKEYSNSIVSNAFLIPSAMFPIVHQSELDYSIKYNYCQKENYEKLLGITFDSDERIETFRIEVSDKNVVPKTVSHQRTFKCLF